MADLEWGHRPVIKVIKNPAFSSYSFFSFIGHRDRCLHFSLTSAGLLRISIEISGGTTVRCWVPQSPDPALPSLLLIHGYGANATWQWEAYVRPLIGAGFNLYVPDLLFFGGSFTIHPDRSDTFQAKSIMAAMEAIGAPRFYGLVGVSYGGFVGYKIASMFPGAVERVVLMCTGVCLEERDLESGLFIVSDLSEAASLLIPQTPEKARELIRLTHHKPPSLIPNCILRDYIKVMCSDYVADKTELIYALIKDRKISDLPKITQPTLIIWGESDNVFPLELGHRLNRHIAENSQLVVIKKAGHAVNMEKPKEVCDHIKAFLIINTSTTDFDQQKETRWRFPSNFAGLGTKRVASNLPLLGGEKA